MTPSAEVRSMTPSAEVIVAVPARERRRVIADLVALTKPRVVVMVIVTTLVGYYVGLNAPPDYARLVQEEVGGLGLRLLFEPGRKIAGNAGILVTRVLYVKHGADKTFTIVDAGMNDLMRPTLYEAYHEIVPVIEPASGTRSIVTDVAGPVCETGDYLARARALPEFKAGDLISVMTAGAYGAVLASEYNSRLLVPEVLVAGNRYSVTRPRPGYDEMLARERLPNWL